MNRFYTILFLFVLTICPSFAFGAKNTMDNVMNSWVGTSINTAIDYLGYPTSEKVIANRHLFYWEKRSVSITGNASGLYGGEYYCTRIFEIDKNKRIKSWEWKGNSCPITYMTSKKWVNPNKDPWKKEKELKKQEKILKKARKEAEKGKL